MLAFKKQYNRIIILTLFLIVTCFFFLNGGEFLLFFHWCDRRPWKLKTNPEKPVDLCQSKGYLIIHNGGRFGNHMCQYAILYGVATRFQLEKIAISQNHWNELVQVFPNISIPYFVNKGCELNFSRQIEAKNFEREILDLGDSNWELSDWCLNTKGVLDYRDDLLDEEFQLDPSLVAQARYRLNDLVEKHAQDKNPRVFVSIHVRRTDYKNHFKIMRPEGGQFLSRHYFSTAMDVMRNHFDNVIFIDDMKWCTENLTGNDVILLNDTEDSTSGRNLDLATAMLCNHSIISFGSFGLWTALQKHSSVTIHPKNWWQGSEFDLLSDNFWLSHKDPCHILDYRGNVRVSSHPWCSHIHE